MIEDGNNRTADTENGVEIQFRMPSHQDGGLMIHYLGNPGEMLQNMATIKKICAKYIDSIGGNPIRKPDDLAPYTVADLSEFTGLLAAPHSVSTGDEKSEAEIHEGN